MFFLAGPIVLLTRDILAGPAMFHLQIQGSRQLNGPQGLLRGIPVVHLVDLGVEPFSEMSCGKDS